MAIFGKRSGESKMPEIDIKASLKVRPPLGKIVQHIHVPIPEKPREVKQKVLKFLSAIESAFKVRERDGEVQFRIDGDYIEIFRMVGSEKELRYQRWGNKKAVLHCDDREYENLKALGLIRE